MRDDRGSSANPEGGLTATLSPAWVHQVLSEMMPEGVQVAVWGVHTESTLLTPLEESAIARAVESRRDEFAKGRACARAALRALRGPEAEIPVGANREPVWPSGFVGSISHCSGVAAAAVATSSQISGLGIDIEVNRLLTPAERSVILSATEERSTAGEDAILVFSAKESVFKAVYPRIRAWIGFKDVMISLGDSGEFVASPLIDRPGYDLIPGLRGRVVSSGRAVATAAWTAGSVPGAGSRRAV